MLCFFMILISIEYHGAKTEGWIFWELKSQTRFWQCLCYKHFLATNFCKNKKVMFFTIIPFLYTKDHQNLKKIATFGLWFWFDSIFKNIWILGTCHHLMLSPSWDASPLHNIINLKYIYSTSYYTLPYNYTKIKVQRFFHSW